MADITVETLPPFTAEFRDCDQYYEAIDDVDVRFTLQGLETSLWRICSLPLPRGINIQCCWSGSGSLAQGVSRKGGFELAVPASGQYTANGQPVPVESLLFMVPGSEFLVSIPKSHSWFGVFVPESLAVSIGLPVDSTGRIRSDTQILHNEASAGCSLPSLLTRFFAMAHSAPEITRSADALGRFEAELLYVLGSAYGHQPEPPQRSSGRPAIVDHVSVNRALDAIEASTEPALAMSQWAAARDHCRRAVELDERSSGAWNSLGVALYYLGEGREALAAWERAVELDPAQYDTLYNIGIKAAELGESDKARDALRRFVRTAPPELYASDIAAARAKLRELEG